MRRKKDQQKKGNKSRRRKAIQQSLDLTPEIHTEDFEPVECVWKSVQSHDDALPIWV